MIITRSVESSDLPRSGCVATIGNFDGVHIGHQQLLNTVVAKAKTAQLPSLVMIFEPQPQEWFARHRAPPRLTRLRDKICLLKSLGIDRVLCLSFRDQLAKLSAPSFIQRYLLDQNVKWLSIGEDFRFGCNRQGDLSLLKKAAKEHDFHLDVFSTIQVTQERVSSTRIRRLLQAGQLEVARQLLGRPYTISGRVIHGQRIGRQLGFPTVNLSNQGKPMPIRGIFAAKVFGLDRVYYGAANVGVRPAIKGTREWIEVHLFDFNQTIYGKIITIEFCQQIREEKNFDTLDALKRQIQLDVEAIRTLFG